MDPEIGPVYGDEPLAEIVQGGFGGGADVRLGQHDPHRPSLLVDHLAVADLVVHLAQGMLAGVIAADAQGRFLGHLDLGDQGARGRVPTGELDAGGLADQTASSVAPDEILPPHRLAVGQLDVDAGIVLRETGDLDAVVDLHPQLADPAGQDPLDVVLPKPEPVVVPGREVADVQSDAGEARDLRHLSLRKEPIRDAALVEDLDGAGLQPACARACEVLAGAPLEDRNVDASQCQLACQHQPSRACSGDHHSALGHVTLRSGRVAPGLGRR